MKIKIYFTLLFSVLFYSIGFGADDKPFITKQDVNSPIINTVLPSFLKLPQDERNNHLTATPYSLDTLSNTWRPLPLRYPVLEDIQKMMAMSFDPVRFTIKSNKDSVTVGEEIDLTITAEYLDVHGMLMFQFDGSNEYTLKMLMPKGFVVTGGTYYDFIQGKVDKGSRIQTYKIRGFFEYIKENACFNLLRAKKQAIISDNFYLANQVCVFEKVLKPSKVNTSTTSEGLRILAAAVPCLVNGTDRMDRRFQFTNVQYRTLFGTEDFFEFKANLKNKDSLSGVLVNLVFGLSRPPICDFIENATLSLGSMAFNTIKTIDFSTNGKNLENSNGILYFDFKSPSFTFNVENCDPSYGDFYLNFLKPSLSISNGTIYLDAEILNTSITTNFNWTGPNNFSSNQKSFSLPHDASHSGDYFVQYTNSTGCLATSKINVAAPAGCSPPSPPTLTADDYRIDEGSTTTIYAAGCAAPSTVTWSNSLGTGTSKLVSPGTYSATCTNASGCVSSAATITINSNQCNYDIWAKSNASENPGSVGTGDKLTFSGGVNGGTAGAVYAFQWMKNDWNDVVGANSPNFEIASANTSHSGNYRLRVIEWGTNKACYSNSFNVSIAACNYSVSLNYTPPSGGKFYLYSQTNKPCSSCTFNYQHPAGWVTGPSGSYYDFQDVAANRGVYNVTMTAPGGCTATSSVNVQYLARPNYFSLVSNLFCDNITGIVADYANPNVQMKASLQVKNSANQIISNSVPIVPANQGGGVWYYSIPFPEAYKDGNNYTIGVYHENNNYSLSPISGTGAYTKTLSCCKLALKDVTVGEVCDPISKTNSLSFKFVNRNASIPLYYKIYKKKYLEFGGVDYVMFRDYVNIPSTVADNSIVTAQDIPTGEYKIELKQSPLGQATNCVVFDLFTIDCNSLIGGCRAPQITVSPSDTIQEGLGTIPIMYANFLNTDGVKANANANFAESATFDGNSILKMNNMGGWENISAEAWINTSAGNTITVGQMGSGTKQSYLFNSNSKAANGINWKLSVGSNGVNLIETKSGTVSSRVALSYNHNLTGWHYIGVVYEANLPKLYIDGTEVAKAKKSTKDYFTTDWTPYQYQVVGPTSIGAYSNEGFKGLVDEVKVFNKVNSQENILENMLVRNSTAITTNSNVTGYFTFSELTGFRNLKNLGDPENKGEGTINRINTSSDSTLNKINETAKLDWFYNNNLVANNAIQYTIPKEIVRVGNHTYTIKFLGANGEQCETKKTVVVKPAQLTQLSGCFNMESMQFSNTMIAKTDDAPNGVVILKNNYNPSGDNFVWKLESAGGKNYKISAEASGLYLTKNLKNPSLLLTPRDNSNALQTWEIKYLDSLSVKPIVRFYNNASGKLTMSVDDQNINNPLFQNSYESSLNYGGQNFRLTKATCPTPPKPCVSNNKITIEKLSLTNAQKDYLLNNRDKMEVFINKYRKNEGVLEYAPSTFQFQDFIPTKNPNGTINTSAANNYVARLSGYFCAPGTGGYNFTLVGTKGRLYMSPNEDPRGKKLVLNHDQGGGWDNSHKAWNVALTEKRSYYYELLLLDTGDWDYQKMMVDGPGIYNGTNGASMQYFSSIPRDTKPKKVRSDAVACGLMPPAPSLSDDMPNLFVGDTIVAADFKVIVDAVSGANGTFSGNGHANVKYLLDTPIKVRFDGIQVNDYYELVSGEITTEYDKDWGNVVDVDTVLNDFVKEVKSVADAAKTFVETKWEQVTSGAFLDFANEFKEKLAEEYDASTAAAYDAVLACAQGHINTINNNKRLCENFPPDATACNNIANATTGLNTCKTDFNNLETQRNAKLALALQIIKETLETLKNTTPSNSSRNAAATDANVIPTFSSSTITLPAEQINEIGEFDLNEYDPSFKAKIERYYKEEAAYNKKLVSKYYGNLYFNNIAKHKELGESIVAANGSKISKFILDTIGSDNAITPTEKTALINELIEMFNDQIFEEILTKNIYKKL